MSQSETLQLACELIERRSVTPDDAGCQQIMVDRLQRAGFTVEHMRFGEVDNFWAVHGSGGKLLAFAGHTDVVPAGDPAEWSTPPFTATIDGTWLRGRGAADMKGSLAAMVIAAEQFVAASPEHDNRLAFLITSDEEGIAVDGTVKVIEQLSARGEQIDWCLVGEPSSTATVGDVIKNGRRGSLGLRLLVKGVQGHVAYPQLADNPIHRVAPALAELAAIEWDAGNAYFPPTSFQVSNIHAGTGATNVIPGEVEIIANFRFSTESTAEQLQQALEAVLDKHGIRFEADWHLSGQPFLTDAGELVDAAVAAIREVTGTETTLSTAGGTSDGRFIAPTGAQVVELGPVNETIHRVDECTNIAQLEQLTAIYRAIIERLL